MASSGPSHTNQLGLDQSAGGLGATGGNHPGMGGPSDVNQLGVDQTGGKADVGTENFDSGTGQGTTGVSGRSSDVLT